MLADRRLIQIGLKGNYRVKEDPLSWIDYIVNTPDHTNFFEGRVSEYSVAGMTGNFSYDFVEETA